MTSVPVTFDSAYSFLPRMGLAAPDTVSHPNARVEEDLIGTRARLVSEAGAKRRPLRTCTETTREQPQFNAGAVLNPDLDDDREFMEVKRSCEIVQRVVSNFNSRINTLEPRAKKLVTEMNEQLHKFSPIKTEMIGSPTIRAEAPPSPDSSSEDSDHSAIASPPRRVRFSNQADQPAETLRRHSTNPTGGSNSLSDMSALLQALSRLDGRVVPKPEEYTGVYGQGFAEFIESFEEYASHNFTDAQNYGLELI